MPCEEHSEPVLLRIVPAISPAAAPILAGQKSTDTSSGADTGSDVQPKKDVYLWCRPEQMVRAHTWPASREPGGTAGKFKKPRNMDNWIPERADPSAVGAESSDARPRQGPKLAELTCPPLPYILDPCFFAPCRPPCVVVHGCRCVGSADTISDTHPATTGWVLF